MPKPKQPPINWVRKARQLVKASKIPVSKGSNRKLINLLLEAALHTFDNLVEITDVAADANNPYLGRFVKDLDAIIIPAIEKGKFKYKKALSLKETK